MYKLALILRYLRRRRITLIPILAVAAAVFLLIVVLAVMRGFSLFIEDRLRGTLADVVVESADVRGFEGWQEIAATLRSLDGVEAVAPHLSGKGVLTIYGGAFNRAWDFPVLFIGIDPDLENAAAQSGPWKASGIRFAVPPGGDPAATGIVLGREVLSPYDAPLETTVTLTAPTAFDEVGSLDFRVRGICKTGLYEHDRTTVYIPLDAAQKLLHLSGRATSLHARVRNGADLARVKAAIAAALPDPRRFVVKTWMESEKVIIDAMALERIIWAVVLSALLAVAGFCILAVMSLTVIQKTRDIGILRAVGASTRGVLSAFLQYGVIVGVLGATLGLVGAALALRYIDPIERLSLAVFGWTPWPRDVFYFDRIPVAMGAPAMWGFWAWGVATAFAASLYPAWRAARTDPVRTLRIEH